MTATTHMKRGTKVEYRYAGGAIVSGVVVRKETSERFKDWYVLKLTDEAGSYSGCCHVEQIRVVDNRPAFQ